jgi:hypothetical protein
MLQQLLHLPGIFHPHGPRCRCYLSAIPVSPGLLRIVTAYEKKRHNLVTGRCADGVGPNKAAFFGLMVSD